MIKPLAGTDLTGKSFVVCDIENYPDGSVITIDTCWRERGELVHEVFTTWARWWKWVVKRARQEDIFRVIYAHNGGGWDWLSLADYLLREGRKEYQYLTGITAASKLVTMTVQVGKKCTIHLCDSLQLLRSPLGVLAKKFAVTNKIDLGGRLPHEVYESDPELYNRYTRADTESLLEIMEKALGILHENVAPIGGFGYTIGSTAMRVFRSMLDREVFIPTDDRVKTFLREGYKGGRVETFKYGHFKNVTVYDVNSLYPYAMLSVDVPISDRGVWTDTETTFDTPGAYRVSFSQRDTSIPPVLLCGGKGCYEGKGVYFSPELRLLREVDPTGTITVETGYRFLDSDRLFQSYVNRLYALRLADKDGPVSLLAKFLLNSLYGKFAQNPERETLLVADDFAAVFDAMKTGSKVIPIDQERGLYREKTNHAAQFEHVGIAGMITSMARVVLYRGILSAGVENVVYCDTDSVHSLVHLSDSLVGGKIGQFKIEFEGEAVYAGKKLYALRNAKWWGCIGQIWTTKIRAKGVTVGGNNGSDITFDDLVTIAGGGKTLRCEFKQPATARAVFRGETPCKFGTRVRTIKRT